MVQQENALGDEKLGERLPFGTTELFDLASILQMLAIAGRSGTLILACPERWATLRLVGGRVADGACHDLPVSTALWALPAPARSVATRARIQSVLTDVLTWPAGHVTLVPEPFAEDGATFAIDALLIEAIAAQDAQRAGLASERDHTPSVGRGAPIEARPTTWRARLHRTFREAQWPKARWLGR